MKKIISLILATVLVVFAFAACNNNNNRPDESTPTKPIGSKETPKESTPESTPEQSIPQVEVTFEPRDEVVYVVNTEVGLKLRTSTSFANDTNVAFIVDPGTELKRVGFHETWSKVIYNEKEYFCSSSYVATEIPLPPESTPEITAPELVFENVDETVYINTGIEGGTANIYSKPDKNFVITDMALPTEGTAVKRTGVYYENENDPEKLGWSRIIYNNVECYIRNSVVSTTNPGETTDN